MKLKSLSETIDIARKYLGHHIPIRQLIVFLEVAQSAAVEEDVEVGEIGKRCDMCSASTSRTLAALSKWHWRQKPGADLIVLIPLQSDRRRKHVYLTTRGYDLAAEIKEHGN